MASYLDCIVEQTEYYANKHLTADFSVIIDSQVSDTAGIQQTEIRCHKAMIATNSEYLEHTIESSSRWETQSLRPRWGTPPLVIRSINLKVVRADVFELLLAHMYGCKLDLSILEYHQLILLLETSHLFGLSRLTEIIGQCLQVYINRDNIFSLMEKASIYNLKKFSKICEKFLAANCHELLSSDFLNRLNDEQLIYILNELGRDLYINEIDVYNAVNRWKTRHTNLSEAQYRDIRSRCVRYELINETDFDEIVLPSGQYTIEQYEQDLLLHGSKRQRKRRVVETNFINQTNTAISGGYYTDQLIRQSTELFNNQQFTERLNQFPHVKNHSDSDNTHIIVDLGEVRLINCIELHLFDNVIETNNGNYSFSYYIETSTNRDRKYYKVVDHSGYRCRSKQRIYFFPREVRFIRIVGITTYVDLMADPREEYMYIRSLICKLTNYQFDISRGLWTPDLRMTSIDAGCCVPFGLNEPNLEWQRNDWMLRAEAHPNYYTYHEIKNNIRLWNKKYIMAHLPQPIFSNHLSVSVLNEGKLKYKICTARNDPQYFDQPIRDEEIDVNNEIDLNFAYRCVQFIKIQGYQHNALQFKCSKLILPYV